jgi:hypothetical protein
MTDYKQQTAVQQLASLLSVTDRAKYNGVIEQALEEEKNQIIDAILDGKDITDQVIRAAEQYYSQRYKEEN